MKHHGCDLTFCKLMVLTARAEVEYLKVEHWGTSVAQLVKRPTSELSLGFDLRVVSSSPAWGSTLGVDPT